MKTLAFEANTTNMTNKTIHLLAAVYVKGSQAIILDVAEMTILRITGKYLIDVPADTRVREIPVSELMNITDHFGRIDWDYKHLKKTDVLDTVDHLEIKLTYDGKTDIVMVDGSDAGDWTLSSYLIGASRTNMAPRPNPPVAKQSNFEKFKKGLL